jgi:hypothetical protein
MASKKDSVIFYQGQVKICKKYLTSEQFGRLMAALFDLDAGIEPEVDDDIALAFDFMSLQQKIDREKYEKICEKNRENGKKGGAPKGNKNASKQPKQANGFQNNPNDNDKTMIKECKNNVNEQIHDSVILYGRFENVELTGKEYYTLKQEYERVTELINKVSVWLRTHDAEDHFALCIKFADNDKWPKKKIIEPAELPEVVDPLPDEEHEAKVAELKATLNGMFKA